MRALCLFLLLTLCLTSCQSSPKSEISVLSKDSSPPDRIKAVQGYFKPSLPDEKSILGNSKLPADQVGYILYDPETQQLVSSHNPDQAFIPASVTKVYSTVAAIKILGPRYRFKTHLAYSGSIKNHVLYGSLFLKGTGDPFLTASELMQLALSLKSKGIREVRGHLYYDESFLGMQEMIDLTRDDYASYNSGISALSSEFNQVPLYWKPAREPWVMQAYSIPEVPGIELGLSPEEFGEGTRFFYQKGENKDRWLLSPAAVQGGKQSIPIKKPGLFTAQLFRRFAQFQHVSVPEPEKGKMPAHAKIVFTQKSLPLEELVQKVLEYSNNVMAELIHMAAVHKLTGKQLNLQASARVLKKWISQQIPNTPWDQLVLHNGSGLGSTNRTSPRQLLAVLKYADQDGFSPGRNYLSLLPISGWKGTLSERLAAPDTAFRVWAKTGSQSFCNSLAGYLFTQSGRKLLFVILTTSYPGRSQIDREPGPLPSLLSREAGLWSGRARALQDQLLASWIQTY